MKEIKFEQEKQEKTEKKIVEPPIKEKIDTVYNAWMDTKKKEIKIPRKAKVRRNKIKKGWIGVIKIDENKNISGEKQRISGSCFNTKEGLYHATDGREILHWQGKFPVIIQPTWRNNPLDVSGIATKVTKEDKDLYVVNETYGQPYIKARMLADIIKVKGKVGGGIFWIIGIVIAGYIIYSLFTGKLG